MICIIHLKQHVLLIALGIRRTSEKLYPDILSMFVVRQNVFHVYTGVTQEKKLSDSLDLE